jgi:hypothetical protein
MPQFPSDLSFVSYLQYSPRGTSDTAQKSRAVTYAVKRDGILWGHRAIERIVEGMSLAMPDYPVLGEVLGPDAILVPIPRSSPLVSGALWPAHRLCEALVAKGLGEAVLPLLTRAKPIQKSAFSQPGTRPGPQAHYDSVVLDRQKPLPLATRITLIDDVVTRGSTFIGLVPMLNKAFPSQMVRCFAMIRTMSYGDITAIGVRFAERSAIGMTP